jgi:hypothetical protein
LRFTFLADAAARQAQRRSSDRHAPRVEHRPVVDPRDGEAPPQTGSRSMERPRSLWLEGAAVDYWYD